MPSAPFAPTFLYMLGGLVIWSVRFLAVYSLTAISCSRGLSEIVAPTAIAFSVAAFAGCAALLSRAATRMPGTSVEPDRFVHVIAAGVAGLAALAIVWETLPPLLVPVCA